MKFYIKNMVCNRCKTIVKAELDKLGIQYVKVELGSVTMEKKMSATQHNKLSVALKHSGFELIKSRRNTLIEKLKRAIDDLELNSDEELKTTYSDFISLSVNHNFISLNTLFSEIQGMTIEKYIIKQKIEHIKELLGHNEFNLTEIAVKMHYSNAAQLSSQFKSMTGLTPLHFRQLRHISYNNPGIN
jgi:AraC-like DNA-binding protein